MKKMVTLASFALLPAIISGCSSSGGAPQAMKYTADTARATGELTTLNWGIPGSEPASLDWIYDWDYGPSNLVLANMCEGLMRQNPDGSTTPALATKVSKPNDKTYVYTIRDGVKFADGKSMTADDVAFSLNRNLTAKPPSYWGLWYTNVRSITATSANTVTVKLNQPDALFGEMMSTPAGDVGEKAYIERAGANYGTPAGGVMCTGPFAFDSWDRGQSITLKRNIYYWDPTLKAKAQRVVMSFIPDASALNSALLTGQIDGSSGMTVSSFKALQSSAEGRLYINRGTEVVVMQLNDLTRGPLKDKRIRQALRDVVDYKGIANGLIGGYAVPTNVTTPEATWGYAKDTFAKGFQSLPGGVQDLTEAKSLVKAAGAPSQPIVIAVNADDESIANAATSIQASAATIGLNITVKKYPSGQFNNLFFDPTARKSVNVMMNNVSADVTDPLEVLYQVIPGSPYNYTNINDTKLSDLITRATQTSNEATRAELIFDATKVYSDEVYGIPLYAIDARVYLRNGLTGIPVSTLAQWYYPWAATVGKS